MKDGISWLTGFISCSFSSPSAYLCLWHLTDVPYHNWWPHAPGRPLCPRRDCSCARSLPQKPSDRCGELRSIDVTKTKNIYIYSSRKSYEFSQNAFGTITRHGDERDYKFYFRSVRVQLHWMSLCSHESTQKLILAITKRRRWSQSRRSRLLEMDRLQIGYGTMLQSQKKTNGRTSCFSPLSFLQSLVLIHFYHTRE